MKHDAYYTCDRCQTHMSRPYNVSAPDIRNLPIHLHICMGCSKSLLVWLEVSDE